MKSMIRPALVLFLTAAAVAALLSAVYRLTLEPIEAQHARARQAAHKAIMPEADQFLPLHFEETGSIVEITEALRGQERIGYILELLPNGYADQIRIAVGISVLDQEITGIRILQHNETPGLGARAVQEAFTAQFGGKALNAPLTVVKGHPADDEIDAITGATITTKAIVEAVNEAVSWVNGGGRL